MNRNSARKFPEGFLWGIATAPTQLEGHVSNEWTDFVAQDGGTCRVACDHYHRYPEDVQWLTELGVNAYRMGIEWSRLQSGPHAPLNRPELERYIDVLDRLKASGVEPMVVLHHFSNPPWINSAGGWVNPATVGIFVDYAAKLVSALGDRVRLWNTFNEPDTYASLVYLLGGFPPGHKWRLGSFRKVIAHMAEAHFQVSRIIRQQRPAGVSPEVGIAKNWTHFRPFRRFSPGDYLPAALCHQVFNRYVLNAFLDGRRREASTFLGVNYYGQVRFKGFQPLVPASGTTRQQLDDLGLVCDDMVERYPAGLGSILRNFHRRYRLPIYITEHGAASTDSEFRIHDLSQHLHVLREVLDDGVDVRGFFYWTLLDCFEWQFGYSKKFGLISVDFNDPDLPRTMTRVGEFYRGICAAPHPETTARS
jgi:beta-glucosidase